MNPSTRSGMRLAVLAGGAIGTLGRATVDRLLEADTIFPWPTFLVNVAGSGILGWMVAHTLTHPDTDRRIPFLGVGVLGAFTTFGTMMVQVVDLYGGGHWTAAIAYAAASVIGGLAVALATLRIGEAR